MNVLAQLTNHTVVAIVRGVQPSNVQEIVSALQLGGIKAVEITLNSKDALTGIKKLCAAVPANMLVGAGTVLNATEAKAAIDAGAQFIISPSFDAETIHVTKAAGIVSIPGAYTATEILNAYSAGADIVKVFPASSPQYIKDIRGPLSHIPLMPTGGVNLSNIAAFRKAGAVAFGVGSALVDSGQTVTAVYLETLARTAAAFVSALV